MGVSWVHALGRVRDREPWGVWRKSPGRRMRRKRQEGVWETLERVEDASRRDATGLQKQLLQRYK